MSVCPNKNIPDWGDLVSKYGEETAYYIYMKNGDKVPYLQSRESNRFIWEVENRLGLINWHSDNGKNTKVPQSFSEAKIHQLHANIANEYIGDYDIFIENTILGKSIRIEGYPVLKSEYEAFVDNGGEKSVETFVKYKEWDNQRKGLDAFEDVFPKNIFDPYTTLFENDTTQAPVEESADDKLSRTIKDSLPKVEEVILDRNMDSISDISGNTLRVNPDLYKDLDRLYLDIRGGTANPFVNLGISMIKTTKLYSKVVKELPDATEDEIGIEALLRTIKGNPKEIFSDTKQTDKFENWLLKYANWLNNRLGIDKATILKKTISTGDLTDEEWEKNTKPKSSQFELLKTSKITDKSLDDIGRIRKKAISIIQERVDRARRTGWLEDVGDLEELLRKLEDSEIRDVKSIIQFVANAQNVINREFNIYLTHAKDESTNPETFNLELLSRWNNMFKSYSILDDILNLFPDEAFFGKLDKSTTLELKSKLQNLVARKNKLMDQYITKGTDKAVQELGRYSGRIRIQTREEVKAKWRKDNKHKIGKGKEYTKQEALDEQNRVADEYIAKNYNDIMNQTKAMLKEEMYEASEGDVGFITMWLDTLLDTNDMVLAAMVKKMVLAKSKVDVRAKSFKDKGWKIVQELYKEVGYTYGVTNMQDVYDFMLERDSDGNLTGHIIDKVSSSLAKEYEKVKLENAALPKKEASKKNYEWWNKNNPVNKDKFKTALNEYLASLRETDVIKQEDIDAYFDNELKLPEYKKKLWDVFSEESVEGAVMVERWIRENRSSFREPIDKWENPQWKSFQKLISEKPNSPKVKFYNLIKDEMDEFNRKLPFHKRIYSQLPYILKNTVERVTDGQKVKGITKEAFKDLLERRIDEEGRGEYTDMNDEPIDSVPFLFNRPKDTVKHEVRYQLKVSKDKSKMAKERGKEFKYTKRIVYAKTGEEALAQVIATVDNINENTIKIKKLGDVKWESKDQSYNLMMDYARFFRMADNYVEMTSIIPEVDLVSHLIKSREYAQKDNAGNAILKKVGIHSERNVTKKGIDSNLGKMFDHFKKSTMYGQGKIDEGSWDVMGWKLDKAKFRDNINKYASYNMLGLNFMQGMANVSVGEINQIVEAVSGEFITKKDLHKATVEYGKEMPKILGDIGQVVGNSKVTHLNELMDTLNEYDNEDYAKNKRWAKLMSTSTLFFTSHAGEHFLQSRVMMALLMKKKAYNSKGEEIGSIYDNYKVVEGELILNNEVDKDKSGWTEEEMLLFRAKAKRLLAKLHGEYDSMSKNAAQRHSIGRMGMLFRKFIVPGVKRRWQKKQINEFLEEYTEGSYRQMFRFFGNTMSELKALGFASLSENWNELSPREQANIVRAASEIGIAFALSALAGAFMTLKGEADDDKERWMYATAAYLTSRTKSELFFYFDPASTMTILKSPAVATSLIEDVLRLGSQLVFDPTAVYQRGSWKDRPKVAKQVMKLLPVAKQYYKVRDVEDSLIFFKR